MIADYADKLLRKYKIDGTFEGHITTASATVKAHEKRCARNERSQNLVEKIANLDGPIQRRLVVQDNNTQSVYHTISENASEGITRLTADNIADIVGISKRSVESGLQKLRNAGLIKSEGATKTPQIRLVDGIEDSNFTGCILLQKVKKTTQQRQVCQVCQFQECPAHP